MFRNPVSKVAYRILLLSVTIFGISNCSAIDSDISNSRSTDSAETASIVEQGSSIEHPPTIVSNNGDVGLDEILSTSALVAQSIDQQLHIIQRENHELSIIQFEDEIIAHSVSPNSGNLTVLIENNDVDELLFWDLLTGEQLRKAILLPDIANSYKWALHWINPTTLLLLNGELLEMGLDVQETYYLHIGDSEPTKLEYPIDIVARCAVVVEAVEQDLSTWCSIRELDDGSYYVFDSDTVRFVENQQPLRILHKIFGNERGVWTQDVSRYIYPEWQEEESKMILVEYDTNEHNFNTFSDGQTLNYRHFQYSPDGSYLLYSGSDTCNKPVSFCWVVVDTLTGEKVWDTSKLNKLTHSAIWAPDDNIIALAENDSNGESNITFYDVDDEQLSDGFQLDVTLSNLIAWGNR